MTDDVRNTGSELSDNYEVLSDGEDIVEVRAICVGCGESVFEYEMMADQVDSLPDKPLHDSLSCKRKAEAKA